VSDYSAGILATGSYLPKEEIGNEEIARLAGVDVEWIERKTLIKTRRFAAPGEAASDLAVRAAENALEQAGLDPEEIDFLIVSTSTGDHPQPPTSYLVQSALGAKRAACIDINVVCSGFVFGLELARGYLANHPSARVLVIAADVYSRILDYTDRRTAVLFADGAGAVVVGAVPAPYGFIEFDLVSRGDAHPLIGVRAGGSRAPASHETVDGGGHYFRMDGRAVRDFVLAEVPPRLRALAGRAGVGLDEIDHFVPHQPNGVLVGQVAEISGLTKAQVHHTVERYGNTGSAAVAVTLDDAHRAGRIADGDLVLLSAFGGGMAVGSSLLRWGAGS
jgi:3-oxoacyl-(acyl-carrier-protein) synthase III